MVGFLRGLLTNRGTPPAPQPIRSNPVRPRICDALWATGQL